MRRALRAGFEWGFGTSIGIGGFAVDVMDSSLSWGLVMAGVAIGWFACAVAAAVMRRWDSNDDIVVQVEQLTATPPSATEPTQRREPTQRDLDEARMLDLEVQQKHGHSDIRWLLYDAGKGNDLKGPCGQCGWQA